MHTFVGNIGFAAAPPVTAALALLIGWRETLLLVGGVGVPVVLAIVLQSRILNEQKRETGARPAGFLADMRQLLSRPILLFFAFFMVSSMAGAGIQSWLITVLHSTHGLTLEAASSGLTGYMIGAMCGILLGGWVADRTDRHLGFVVALTVAGSALMLWIELVSMPHLAMVGVLFATGLSIGASRTPRDVMVKDAAPPGQIGKVFGFVSAGLALGRRDHAGPLRDADRFRTCRSRAGRRRRAVAGQPVLRRQRPRRPSPDRRRAGPGRITRARHCVSPGLRPCSPWG